MKIFHIADLHLDSAFSGFDKDAADKKREELRDCFCRALRIAKERGAALALIPGDLFDTPFCTLATRNAVFSAIEEFGAPVVIAPGNHDYYTKNGTYCDRDLPENAYVFTSAELGRFDFDELGLSVIGYAFTSDRYERSPLDDDIPLSNTNINILCAHGELCTGFSKYAAITPSQIAQAGFSYAALGHVHIAPEPERLDGSLIAYSGFPQGRSFDELGYKGAMYGIIEKGNVNMQAVRLSKSRYEIATVDISDVADKSRAIEIIRNEIRQFTDDTALRLILTGETETPMLISPNEIGSGCEYPFFIEITDKTYLKPNLTQLEQSNTLKGVFCRKMAELIAQAPPDTEEYRVLTLAFKYGISALEDRNVIDYGGND